MSEPVDAQGRRIRGMDSTLILEPAKRHRTAGSPTLENTPLTRSARHGSVDPSVAANTPATDAAGLDEVRRKGLYLLEKLTSAAPIYEGDEAPHVQFMRLPSRLEYPYYYDMIKLPISFHEIRTKLEKVEYTTIAEVRADFNQCFVNAKRFNAKGSHIFLNAKHLHKLVKTTYEQLTGDHALPEEEDEQDVSYSPVATSAPPLQPKPQYTAAAQQGPAPPTFAKRGPTLKPWLAKKLAETMDMRDPALVLFFAHLVRSATHTHLSLRRGRAYADGFRTLPDRKTWAQYYTVITHPMCFDTIQSKVAKRAYTNVKQFADDVDVMLANALFFNEENSRIWMDARLLQNHFAEVMKEVPPVFVPPRKYNTAKRRAEKEALEAGLTLPPDAKRKKMRRDVGGSEPPEGQSPGFDDGESGEDYDDGGYGSGNAPTPTPYDLPLPPEHVDPFALPGRSRSMTPGTLSSYALPSAAASPTPSGSDHPQSFAAPAAFLPQPNGFPQSPTYATTPITHPPPPATNGNGVHSPLAEPTKPRLIARLPRKGDVPAISRFLVRNTPATVPITLDNTVVRQHSFAVQATTERVDFTPFFRRATSLSSLELDKGKLKELDGSPATLAPPPPESAPFLSATIKISVRPSTTTFESLAELPSPDGPSHRYSLAPKPGLTVVEFLVTPRAGAAPGDQQSEVYRVFITK
ncbi:hypothetical protein RQP46_004376 [Phenoliferia psychrophenolica]